MSSCVFVKMGLLKIVLCFLCCNVVWGSDTYKAATVIMDYKACNYETLVREAGKTGADILVLPSPKHHFAGPEVYTCPNFDFDNYDKTVKTLSSAAKEARVYVVAHLYENLRCQYTDEVIMNYVVFDRDGAVMPVKPRRLPSKCNITTSRMGRFTTDFGVTFGVLSFEDATLTKKEELAGTKNVIVMQSSEGPYVFARNFPQFWAYVNNINIVTDEAMYSGDIATDRHGDFIVGRFDKNGVDDVSKILNVSRSYGVSQEHFSQYVIRPLDLRASSKGYRETVCHDNFCCEFYVKTSHVGCYQSYGLVVFDGVHTFVHNAIGVKVCSVMACPFSYKRSCCNDCDEDNYIRFEKISINGNFTKENSDQFPAISRGCETVLTDENFTFKHHSADRLETELYNVDKLVNFGIFGREYSRDYEIMHFYEADRRDLTIWLILFLHHNPCFYTPQALGANT